MSENGFVKFFIVFSLAGIVWLYLFLSKREKSFINILTPMLLIFIPANYVFELIHIQYNGLNGEVFSYVYVYVTYTAYFAAFVAGYLLFKPKNKINRFLNFNINLKDLGLIPLLMLIFGVALYLPILIKFSDIIVNPREIYEKTRVGYGALYFLSTTFIYLSFILYLFKGKIFVPLIASLILVALHGSKGQILSLFLILIMFLVYVRGKRYSIKKSIFYVTSLSLLVLSTFWFVFRTRTDFSIFDVAEMISSYADYTRNTILVIEDYGRQELGRIFFEDNFYARVPRALFPDKPLAFGEIRLTEEFYPARLDIGTGNPSFGLLGKVFADFGYFSIVFMILAGMLRGLLLKYFRVQMSLNTTPGKFIIFIFLCGIPLIPIGSGFLLVEHLLFGYLLDWALHFKKSIKNPSKDMARLPAATPSTIP